MNSEKPGSKKARISGNVIALGVVSLFTDAASEMIYPLIPLFVTMLGSGIFILGVIEGVAETTASILKLVSGIVSDKIGKRKLLVVIGYATSTFIRPLTGAVGAAWQIVPVRMIDRVGKGIRTAPRDALIAASTDDSIRGKAFGFHRAMDHAGAILGPLLAIAVLLFLVLALELNDTVVILRWTFYLSIIPGVLALLALLFFVSEKIDTASPAKPLRFSLKQFDKSFMRYLGVVLLFTLGNSSDAFLLLRVQETLHNSTSLYSLFYSLPLIGDMVTDFGDANKQKVLMDILFIPLVWAFFHVIKVAFSTRLGALSDRIGRKIVINTGWSIYALVYAGFAFLDQVPGYWQIVAALVLIAIYALYYAFCEGAEKAFVADFVRPEQRGSAYGLFNFSVGLGALPASIIFGFLYEVFGAAAAFGTGACIAVISVLLLATTVNDNATG